MAAARPEKLSKAAAAAIRSEENRLEVSAISLTEIAIKDAKGSLNFPREAVAQAIADLLVRVLPYTEAHAYQFFELPPHHTDPFDRLIIAQALVEQVPVVTSDVAFKRYRGLKVVW